MRQVTRVSDDLTVTISTDCRSYQIWLQRPENYEGNKLGMIFPLTILEYAKLEGCEKHARAYFFGGLDGSYDPEFVDQPWHPELSGEVKLHVNCQCVEGVYFFIERTTDREDKFEIDLDFFPSTKKLLSDALRQVHVESEMEMGRMDARGAVYLGGHNYLSVNKWIDKPHVRIGAKRIVDGRYIPARPELNLTHFEFNTLIGRFYSVRTFLERNDEEENGELRVYNLSMRRKLSVWNGYLFLEAFSMCTGKEVGGQFVILSRPQWEKLTQLDVMEQICDRLADLERDSDEDVELMLTKKE